MAGRRRRRRAVRRQLRGGRREQHPARRRRLRGVPVGDRRRAALARPAPHEHGIDLRIRLARRLLAAVADVHRARHPGHGLRRRDRAAAQPRGGRRHERGRLGDRLARPQMDRLQGFLQGRRARAHARGDPHPHGGHRRAAARLVHRPLLDPLDRARDGGGRLPLLVRHLCRRAALLARRAERAVPRHPLHARRQRHALRHAAGLQLRRPVLRLSQGQLRRALRRGRSRRAEDDVGRPALPARRPARPRRGARPLPRLRAGEAAVWLPRRIDIARHWHAHHKPRYGS